MLIKINKVVASILQNIGFNNLKVVNMIFHQLFDKESSTFTYLIGCAQTQKAALIDPVESETKKYIALLELLGLKLIYTLETHVHADHITGADFLRQKLGSKSVVHKDSGAKCADILVNDNDKLMVGKIEVNVLHTPGHTNGCVSYLIENMIFTGDALLINSCGRTDFQMGNASQLYDSIHNKIFQLPNETLVYPGHDYNEQNHSTIGFEKKNNKRLKTSISKERFIGIMAELQLDYPKKIKVALPANLNCGQISSAN